MYFLNAKNLYLNGYLGKFGFKLLFEKNKSIKSSTFINQLYFFLITNHLIKVKLFYINY